MKKIITIVAVGFFVLDIYILPSAYPITLGEIKPDTSTESNKVSTSGDKKDLLTEDKKISGNEKQTGSSENEKDYVSPRLVCLLSVILPGGGHFYLNNDAKGMSFCLAAGAGYTATGFFMIKTMLAERGSVAYKNYLLLTGFMFFITLIVHFIGIIEAYSDADEINKKNIFSSGSDNPYRVNIVKEKK